jgi:hypothetical protein
MAARLSSGRAFSWAIYSSLVRQLQFIGAFARRGAFEWGVYEAWIDLEMPYQLTDK